MATDMLTTTKYFEHRPLSRNDQQIRLVRILPREKTAELNERSISCHIEHYNLASCVQKAATICGAEEALLAQAGDTIENPREADDATQYVALSYTWGAEGSMRVIYVNNLPFMIRVNLYDFLCAMQDRAACDTLFWIDQLSINQSDTPERNQQVAMMAEVYTGAASVYVWLGIDTPRTEAAFLLLEEYTAAGRLPDEEGRQRVAPLTCPDDVVEAHGLEGIHWDLLTEIFDRPYWSRLWIVQEVCLARRHLKLLCGPYSYFLPRLKSPPHPLIDSLDWTYWKKHFNVHEDTLDGMRQALQLLALREHFDNNSNFLNFESVLTAHCQRSCSDPRDKVYGLQACVQPSRRISADYTLTTEEVFETVLHHLQFTDSTITAVLIPTLRREMGLVSPQDLIKDKDTMLW